MSLRLKAEHRLDGASPAAGSSVSIFSHVELEDLAREKCDGRLGGHLDFGAMREKRVQRRSKALICSAFC